MNTFKVFTETNQTPSYAVFTDTADEARRIVRPLLAARWLRVEAVQDLAEREHLAELRRHFETLEHETNILRYGELWGHPDCDLPSIREFIGALPWLEAQGLIPPKAKRAGESAGAVL